MISNEEIKQMAKDLMKNPEAMNKIVSGMSGINVDSTGLKTLNGIKFIGNQNIKIIIPLNDNMCKVCYDGGLIIELPLSAEAVYSELCQG